MEEDNTLLKIGLLFAAIFIMVVAWWRVSSYKPTPQGRISSVAVSSKSTSTGQATSATALQTLKEKELLEDAVTPSVSYAHILSPVPGFVLGTDKSFSTPARVTAHPSQTGSSPRQTTGRLTPPAFYNATTQTPRNSPSSLTASAGHASAAQQTDFASRVQEERARALAPYLRPNQQEKQRMEAQWNKLSAALERAIAKALMPKSKKEEMIEKYGAKQNTQNSSVQFSGFTGPLAPVGEQIAIQKQAIVQSMGSAFGGRAAAQAGSLMDSYAQELAGALNAPNATPEQKEQRVKEISKKYQNEMNKLAEKNQYDKFVADRVAQDNKQKEELGALYPEQKAQISQLIDQTREKDLALATQNLPREQYFDQLAQNNQDLRSGIQKLVVQGGQSVQDFQKWEQDRNADLLNTLARLEEEGKIQSVAAVANADEKQQTQSEINTQSAGIKKEIAAAYGEQALADFNPIFENYERTLKQIDEAKLSPLERATQKDNATKEANRQLIEVEIQHVEKMNITEEQKQVRLEKLRQKYNSIK